MPRPEDELLPTRHTLLARLGNHEDDASWREFFDTYWRLIYDVARRAGLTDSEAQDVVQETMLSVARHMPSFRYDPAKGSFKAWLLNLTRWRIIDQIRKRAASGKTAPDDPFTEAGTEAGAAVTELWEDEWQNNIRAAALARIKRKLDPAKYQAFDFHVNKGWPADKVSKAFGITTDQVFLIKHRIIEMLKAEIKRLEDTPY